eukprot:3461081-Rhodomonas_salina.1
MRAVPDCPVESVGWEELVMRGQTREREGGGGMGEGRSIPARRPAHTIDCVGVVVAGSARR